MATLLKQKHCVTHLDISHPHPYPRMRGNTEQGVEDTAEGAFRLEVQTPSFHAVLLFPREE